MGDPKRLQELIDELGRLTHTLAENIKNPLNTEEDFKQCAADADQLTRTLLLAADIRRNISSTID